jgi:hypothetical protein
MARQNDHNRVEELISAYLDKRVSPEEQSFFERHIASCADCRAQLETTRSMIAALQAMPAVKAPRSFVLPREMAKQPKRSFMSLYPALRLATVVAAVAFVVLFAGDLLIGRSGGNALQSIPAAAPARLEVQAPQAARQAAPTQEPTAAESVNDAATAPSGGIEPPGAGAPLPKAAISETLTMTASTAAASTATSMPTATPATTATPAAAATAEVAQQMQATPAAIPAPAEPLSDQQAGPASGLYVSTNVVTPPSAIDPLRIVEIALLVLAIVLGIATFVVRRKQA